MTSAFVSLGWFGDLGDCMNVFGGNRFVVVVYAISAADLLMSQGMGGLIHVDVIMAM